MTNRTKHTILAVALCFIIAVLASLPSCTTPQNKQSKIGHQCAMEDCDKIGNKSFTSDYEEGTDGYLFDLTHYKNPYWSYEQCEEFVFSSGIPLTTGNQEQGAGDTNNQNISGYSIGGGAYLQELLPYQKIIKLTTDTRGLISIVFIDERNDTTGLDFLTIKGFNHFLKGEMDSLYNDNMETVLSIQTGGGEFTVNPDKVRPFILAENIDTLLSNWEYNLQHEYIWSLDSNHLATIAVTSKKGSHLLFIPYKPYGICCKDYHYKLDK